MALATRKTCAVSGGIGPLWCAGRPAANRAALPPAAKSGGPPTKIGRPGSIEKVGGHPLNKIGRPDRSGGRAAALGRRAALRAATLKLRAARMWPALGRWAARGGRGARPCVWQQGGPLTRLNNCAECWLLRAAPPLRPCSSLSARPTAHRRACANPPPLTSRRANLRVARGRPSSFGASGRSACIRMWRRRRRPSVSHPPRPRSCGCASGPRRCLEPASAGSCAVAGGGPSRSTTRACTTASPTVVPPRAANAPGHRRWAGRLPGPRGRRAARRGQILQEEARCRVQNRYPRGFIRSTSLRRPTAT